MRKASFTRLTIQELGWETSPYLLYFPNFVPSDYYHFRSLDNILWRECSENQDQMQNWLSRFFMLKPPKFYLKGTDMLATLWEQVASSEKERM